LGIGENEMISKEILKRKEKKKTEQFLQPYLLDIYIKLGNQKSKKQDIKNGIVPIHNVITRTPQCI
jgi:hypothetical protein